MHDRIPLDANKKFCTKKNCRFCVEKKLPHPHLQEITKDTALNFFEMMVDALFYMHASERQIVHRDIKPDNIMLDSTGAQDVIKFIDYGEGKQLFDNQQIAEEILKDLKVDEDINVDVTNEKVTHF